MEVFCKKNKTAPPQLTCTIPFLFKSQVDFTTSYIDEAIERGIILQKGPYFYFIQDEAELKFLGKQNLRDYVSGPEVLEELKGLLEQWKRPEPAGTDG